MSSNCEDTSGARKRLYQKRGRPSALEQARVAAASPSLDVSHDVTPTRRREHSERQKALQQVKELKIKGVKRFHQYEVGDIISTSKNDLINQPLDGDFPQINDNDKEDRLYDEVNEADYKILVKKRLKENDFVIDDDGQGYADYGTVGWEEEDNDETHEFSTDENDVGKKELYSCKVKFSL
jgi:hypothetical protein